MARISEGPQDNNTAAIVPRRRRHCDAALGGRNGISPHDLRL